MVKTKTFYSNIFLLAVSVICGWALLGSTTKTQAATFSVSSGIDGKSADSTCRLSEAIENINNQTQTHADCAAGTGNDVIQLPTGTITLTADLPTITRTVTIRGSGAGKTILSGGQYAIFQTNSASADVAFKDFTTRGGSGFGVAVMDASSVSVTNIETDGTGSIARDDGNGSTILGGFAYIGLGASEPPALTIDGLYVHDYSSTDAGLLLGVAVMGPMGKTQQITAKNITVKNLSSSNPAGQLIAIFNTTGLGDGYASLNASYENITIDGISTPNALNAGGLTLSGVIGGGDSVGVVSVKNATIRNITTGPAAFGANGAIGLVGGGIGADDHFDGTLKLQNVLIANSSVDGSAKSCSKSDIGGLLGGLGTTTLTVESLGGNMVDDASCADFFTHQNDQKNVAGLKDKLGAMSNNGGNIPTIPLLAGSRAIDAGVCLNAPSKDARGVLRPQGIACDAGAFELVQASAAQPSGVTNPTTGKQVYIEAPVEGAVVKAAETFSTEVVADDADFEYPLGLTSFTVDGVPAGSTQTMTLYFESDEKAQDFQARKINLQNNTFKTIEGATLENTTHNGKTVIKLSYPVTDGGELDTDGAVNGAFTDPVGLAKQKQQSLVNTGVLTAASSIAAALLITGVILVNLDYRKHKAPLLQMDKEMHQHLADEYTLWHHVNVVTIPVMKYRVSVVLDKKSRGYYYKPLGK